ncbi:MAG: DMT family transporter, partial [Pyramidobacter sp.]|nr:DMT family transporter [Pyramidobacter sp.]
MNLLMWKYYCASMGAVLFWCASYLVTALAYETISPLQLGLVRAVLAGVLFFAFRAVTGAHEKVARSDWPRLVVSGLFGVTLYFAFQNTAIAMTSTSRAALITACYPV